jgi:hypothetical protein
MGKWGFGTAGVNNIRECGLTQDIGIRSVITLENKRLPFRRM